LAFLFASAQQINRKALAQVHHPAPGGLQQRRVVRLLQQVGDQVCHFSTLRLPKAPGGQRRRTDANAAGDRRFLRVVGNRIQIILIKIQIVLKML